MNYLYQKALKPGTLIDTSTAVEVPGDAEDIPQDAEADDILDQLGIWREQQKSWGEKKIELAVEEGKNNDEDGDGVIAEKINNKIFKSKK